MNYSLLVTGTQTTECGVVLHTDQGPVDLSVGNVVNFAVSSARQCIGYRLPSGDCGPCPNTATLTSGTRCSACEKLTAMGACLRCKGTFCVNQKRRDYCVPVDHLVYLAYYGQEIVKVGVTKSERFQQRIFEQGAIAAIPIRASNGQDVRRVERMMIQKGWPDRVNVVKLLDQPIEHPDRCESILRESARQAQLRFPTERFGRNGQLVWVGDRLPEPLKHRPRVVTPDRDALSGRVVGNRGGLLLLTDMQQTYAMKSRSLIGRTISPRFERSIGPAQTALALAC